MAIINLVLYKSNILYAKKWIRMWSQSEIVKKSAWKWWLGTTAGVLAMWKEYFVIWIESYMTNVKEYDQPIWSRSLGKGDIGDTLDLRVWKKVIWDFGVPGGLA